MYRIKYVFSESSEDEPEMLDSPDVQVCSPTRAINQSKQVGRKKCITKNILMQIVIQFSVLS